MEHFNDFNGEPIFKGDTIRILDHHNYIFNDLEALVGWDEKNGMFTFNPIDKQLKGNRDFYGMGKFLKVKK